MRVWSIMLWLTAWVPLAASDGTHVDLVADVRPAHVLMATTATLLDQPVNLSPTATAAELGNMPTAVAMRRATPATARQLVGHALQVWWAPLPGGGAVFGPERSLPRRGEVIVTTHMAATGTSPSIESEVASILEPWLGPGHGLAHHPFQGMWAATMDAGGHAQLIALLAALERGEALIPPRLPPIDQRPAPGLQRRVVARNASELVTGLAEATGASVALDPHLAASGTITAISIPAGDAESLRRSIAAQGWHAAWIANAWCIGVTPPSVREHPANRLVQAVIPIPHLAADAIDLELTATRLRSHIGTDVWQLPGHVLMPLNDVQSLLVRADPGVVDQVMENLAQWDAEAPAR